MENNFTILFISANERQSILGLWTIIRDPNALTYRLILPLWVNEGKTHFQLISESSLDYPQICLGSVIDGFRIWVIYLCLGFFCGFILVPMNGYKEMSLTYRFQMETQICPLCDLERLTTLD